MKRISIFSALSIVLIVCACQSDESLSTSVSESNLASFAKLDIQAKKLAYNLLTPTERKTIWERHYSSIMESNTLTQAQEKIVVEAAAFTKSLNHEYLPNRNISAFEKEWLPRARMVFNDQQIRNLSYSIPMSSDLQMRSVVHPDNEPASCQCNIGSAFTCDDVTTCSEAKCDVGRLGCGFAGLFDCDGMCKANPI